MKTLKSVDITICTECPKMYCKSVLHLLKAKLRKSILKQMQYRFAVNFWTLCKILKQPDTDIQTPKKARYRNHPDAEKRTNKKRLPI